MQFLLLLFVSSIFFALFAMFLPEVWLYQILQKKKKIGLILGSISVVDAC